VFLALKAVHLGRYGLFVRQRRGVPTRGCVLDWQLKTTQVNILFYLKGLDVHSPDDRLVVDHDVRVRQQVELQHFWARNRVEHGAAQSLDLLHDLALDVVVD
jgi:hypothetical protein